MPEEMFNETLRLMGAVVVAIVAAYIAAFLAILKIRKERAFDRQLVWCESMLRALNAAGAAVTSAIYGTDPEGREACWTETIELYEQLIPLCGLKDIYAKEDAVKEIQGFMRALAGVIESHLVNEAVGVPFEKCDECLKNLQDTASELAKIGREHLKLPALTPGVIKPGDRFQGSFKGRGLGKHKVEDST